MCVCVQRIWYLRLDDMTEPPLFHSQFDIEKRWLTGALNFLTMVTLYSTLIPISLYVSIEIVKYIQVGLSAAFFPFRIPCPSFLASRCLTCVCC